MTESQTKYIVMFIDADNEKKSESFDDYDKAYIFKDVVNGVIESVNDGIK